MPLGKLLGAAPSLPTSCSAVAVVEIMAGGRLLCLPGGGGGSVDPGRPGEGAPWELTLLVSSPCAAASSADSRRSPFIGGAGVVAGERGAADCCGCEFLEFPAPAMLPLLLPTSVGVGDMCARLSSLRHTKLAPTGREASQGAYLASVPAFAGGAAPLPLGGEEGS